MWSVGCVLAELLTGKTLFQGQSGIGQLVEIIKVLGTPTENELSSMNKNYTDFNLPKIEPRPWKQIVHSKVPEEAIDLLSKFLRYDPKSRISALDACAHPFFNELRNPNTKLPNQRDLPELFDFDAEELNSVKPQIRKVLVQKSKFN